VGCHQTYPALVFVADALFCNLDSGAPLSDSYRTLLLTVFVTVLVIPKKNIVAHFYSEYRNSYLVSKSEFYDFSTV
jgi:hypothetical protein